jgi:hypothetical protein
MTEPTWGEILVILIFGAMMFIVGYGEGSKK